MKNIWLPAFLVLGLTSCGGAAGGLAAPGGPRDGDQDGLVDDQDKCPAEAEDFDEFQDEDGCPEADDDNDGVPDHADGCPSEPEDKDQMEDEDGCPEADDDGDGFGNRVDQCPAEAEDKDGYLDEDGCPDVDNDADSFLDTEDKCVMVPESYNNVKDDDGCPEFIDVEGDKVTFKKRIRWIKGEPRLHDSAFAALEELAGLIVAFPEWKTVRVRVHTSGRGPAAESKALAEQRAMTVVGFLAAAGVVQSRLAYEGIGDAEPLAPADAENAAQTNERIEVVISR